MANKGFRYKNISEQPQALAGFGTVLPGDTIESEVEINNPNFKIDFGGDRKTGVEPEPQKPKAKSKK